MVLGLIFLKYISDAFDELYNKLQLEEEKIRADPENKEEYTAERVLCPTCRALEMVARKS
jgi:type I restriction enzyme M protein